MPNTRRARAFALATLCAACATQQPADLIVTNATVYTLSWDEPASDGTPAPNAPHDTGGWHADAEAVVVRGGSIVFVGKSSDAMRFKGSATKVLDANGMTVLPGLVDTHVHLANLGASLRRVNLVGVTTEEEAVRLVAERAASTPEGEWIVGYGWDEGAWANHYPDRKLLSERVPKHPVWLAGLHTFAGWANDLALDRAQITRATRPSSGGEIRKDAAGHPTGLFLNTAVRLVESAIPQPTDEEMDARMSAALDAVARAGYTAVHDANTDSLMLASLQRLDTANKIPVRVSVFLAASDSNLVRSWLSRGPDTASSSMLVVRGVKAFYDGALGSRGALLLEPYADRPAEKGRGGAEYGFNAPLMDHALDRGFQIMIHAIGDSANRATLGFFAEAAAQNARVKEGRHRIEHAQILAPSELSRFAELGVVASMQPGHAIEDKAWAEARVGSERIKGGYAWRDLRMNNAKLLLSSDMPGSSYDVFYMLNAAISRRDPSGEPAGGWFPAQRLTPEEAVRGFTSWAAYASFTEKDAGAITVGRRADLTILDRDPFVVGARDPAKLLGGRAIATVVGGRIVYAEGAK